MTYGQCTDRADTFSYTYWQGPMIFAEFVVTAGVLTFFCFKNDSAPALFYSKSCMAPYMANGLVFSPVVGNTF